MHARRRMWARTIFVTQGTSENVTKTMYASDSEPWLIAYARNAENAATREHT